MGRYAFLFYYVYRKQLSETSPQGKGLNHFGNKFYLEMFYFIPFP